MQRQEARQLLEEMLELAPQSLTGAEKLRDIPAWDSLSTITFIAMVDKEFGVPLSGNRVARCQTVDELCGLVDEAVGAGAA